MTGVRGMTWRGTAMTDEQRIRHAARDFYARMLRIPHGLIERAYWTPHERLSAFGKPTELVGTYTRETLLQDIVDDLTQHLADLRKEAA